MQANAIGNRSAFRYRPDRRKIFTDDIGGAKVYPDTDLR